MAFYGFVAGRIPDGGHVDTFNAWFLIRPRVPDARGTPGTTNQVRRYGIFTAGLRLRWCIIFQSGKPNTPRCTNRGRVIPVWTGSKLTFFRNAGRCIMASYPKGRFSLKFTFLSPFIRR